MLFPIDIRVTKLSAVGLGIGSHGSGENRMQCFEINTEVKRRKEKNFKVSSRNWCENVSWIRLAKDNIQWLVLIKEKDIDLPGSKKKGDLFRTS
jgi:hypothetical protein